MLLLDAGDAIQGSPLETFYRRGERTLEEPVIGAMNRVGYDAMAVGNHEFSYGWDELDRARTASRHRWLRRQRRAPRRHAGVRRVVGDELAARFASAWSGSRLRRCRGSRTPHTSRGCASRTPSPPPGARCAAAREGALRRRRVLAAHRPRARSGDRDASAAAIRPARTSATAWRASAGADRRDPRPHSPDRRGGRDRRRARDPGRPLRRSARPRRPRAEARGAAGDRWTIASRARARPRGGATEPRPTRRSRASPSLITARAGVAGPAHRLASRDVDAPAGRFADSALWELIHRAQLRPPAPTSRSPALADPSARIARGPITVRDAFRVYGYDNTIGVVAMTGATAQADARAVRALLRRLLVRRRRRARRARHARATTSTPRPA